MQKKQEPVAEKEKRSIVTPDVEVTILRNANLDLEVILFQFRLVIESTPQDGGYSPFHGGIGSGLAPFDGMCDCYKAGVAGSECSVFA